MSSGLAARRAPSARPTKSSDDCATRSGGSLPRDRPKLYEVNDVFLRELLALTLAATQRDDARHVLEVSGNFSEFGYGAVRSSMARSVSSREASSSYGLIAELPRRVSPIVK
jgi:hypothetical protein